MEQRSTPHQSGRQWLRLLLGTISALVLLPLPALATLTFSSWSITGAAWDLTGSNGDNSLNTGMLVFQPQGGSSGVTVTMKSTVTVGGSDTILGTNTPSGGAVNLTTDKASFFCFVSGNGVQTLLTPESVTAENQFSGSQPAPVFNSGVAVSSAFTYTLTVKYTFNSNSVWSAATTPYTLTFGSAP